MATTEQIARAKARVALARCSGKTLPDHVLERAALDYSDAEPAKRAGNEPGHEERIP